MVSKKTKDVDIVCADAIKKEHESPKKKKRKNSESDTGHTEADTGTIQREWSSENTYTELTSEKIHSRKKRKLGENVRCNENGFEETFNGNDSLPLHENDGVSLSTEFEEHSDVSGEIDKLITKKPKKKKLTSENDLVETEQHAESTKKKKRVSFVLAEDENDSAEEASTGHTDTQRKHTDIPELTPTELGEELEKQAAQEEMSKVKRLKTPKKDVPPRPKLSLLTFDAEYFRKNVSGPQGFGLMVDFAILTTSQKADAVDVVAEYLKAGGGPMEILQQIETTDHGIIDLINVVFKLLHAIIMRSLTDKPEIRPECEKVGRHLLNVHLPTLQKMLSDQVGSQYLKSSLNLLTGMVNMSAVFAKDILANINFTPKLMKALVRLENLGEKTSVRSCFINFLISYLIDDNTALIQTLLQKQGLLASIFPGLVFDRPEIVHLFLTAVRTHIVENRNISKSLKRVAFNTNIIKLLLKVFSWCGPKKGAAKGARTSDEIDPEAKAIVLEAVQQLMVVLCTSHKLGVIFHDPSMGTSKKNVNELMYSVIKETGCPWENAHIGDLVIRILATCPDLIRGQLNSMLGYLEPRNSPSWLQSMDFLKRIVEAMDPDECLKPNLKFILFSNLATVVQQLCSPPAILRVLREKMLTHKEMVVRHAAAELLLSMVGQLQRFFSRLDEWGILDDDNRDVFRSAATKFLPRSTMLMSAWSMVTNDSHQEDSPSELSAPKVSVSDHLSIQLDVMMIYHQICLRTLPSKDSEVALTPQPLTLELQSLFDAIQQVDDEAEVAALQVKAVSVVLEIDRQNFLEDKKTLTKATRLLLNCVNHTSVMVSQSARSTLTALFQRTGLFKNSMGEESIWIHCYCQLDVEQRKVAAKVLTGALVRILKQPEKYKLAEKERKYKIDCETSRQVISSCPGPLLRGVLIHMSKKDISTSEINDFLSSVIIHLLHSTSSSATVVELIKKKFVNENINNYVASSDKNSDHVTKVLKSVFGKSSLEYKLSRYLHDKSKYKSALEVLKCGDIAVSEIPKIEVGSKSDVANMPLPDHLSPDPTQMSLLFNLALYQLSKVILKKKLTEEVMLKYEDVFKTILQFLKQCSSPANSSNAKTLLENQKLDLHCTWKFFSHPVFLKTFSLFTDDQNEVKLSRKFSIQIVLNLVHWMKCNYPSNILDSVLRNYREKVIRLLVSSQSILCKKTSMIKRYFERYKMVVNFVMTFELGYEDIVLLLKAVFDKKQSYSILVVEDSSNTPSHLSVWGDLLVYLMGHIVILHQQNRKTCGALSLDLIKSISQAYASLRRTESLNLTSLEDSLIKYLQCFPHSQESFADEAFTTIVKTVPGFETSIELGVQLLSRNIKLQYIFSNALSQESEKLLENSSMVFAYCACLVEDTQSDAKKVLPIIYKRYCDDVVHGIKKPHKALPWMMVHTNVVVALIEKCFTLEQCIELCDYIENHQTKLESYGFSEFHVTLVESLFVRCQSLGSSSDTNQILRLTNILLKAVTHVAQDKFKLDFLCKTIKNCVQNVTETSNWESIQQNSAWRPFTIQVLKLGLQSDGREYDPVLLLQTLISLCQVIYKDSSNNKEVSQLFEMTLSHSEFLGIVLRTSPAKHALMQLLITFVTKSPEVMSSKHFPILLGAYNATLSSTDQIILKLINAYEANNVSMYECRPYLWGEAAVNYYCVKMKENVSLWRQPTMVQVLDLLNNDIVLNTIRRYPLKRTTTLKEFQDQPDVYDPVFFLPLFSHLLAPEAVVQPHKFTHTGGLALTLASLANESFDVRAMAYHVLSRYHFHLEASRGRDKEWWMHFLNAIRNGIVDLGEEGVQLACVVSTFLARTSLLISRPLDPLFKPLQRFILAKPSMNLNTIPELYILFNSTDLKSTIHRHFILEVLRDGFRLMFDWNLAMKCVIFQLLFTYYSSIVAANDERSKVLILEVTSSAVKLPDVAKYFTSGYGFFSWFHQVIREMTSSNHYLVVAAIQVVTSLWETSFGASGCIGKILVNKDFFTTNVALMLTSILMRLPPSMSLQQLCDYLRVLDAVSMVMNVMNSRHLLTLVQFCKAFLGPLDDFEDMVEFGCKYISGTDLVNDSSSKVAEAKSCLRRIIIVWYNQKKKKCGFMEGKQVGKMLVKLPKLKVKKRTPVPTNKKLKIKLKLKKRSGKVNKQSKGQRRKKAVKTKINIDQNIETSVAKEDQMDEIMEARTTKKEVLHKEKRKSKE